jgi:hypothetical protein
MLKSISPLTQETSYDRSFDLSVELKKLLGTLKNKSTSGRGYNVNTARDELADRLEVVSGMPFMEPDTPMRDKYTSMYRFNDNKHILRFRGNGKPLMVDELGTSCPFNTALEFRDFVLKLSKLTRNGHIDEHIEQWLKDIKRTPVKEKG